MHLLHPKYKSAHMKYIFWHIVHNLKKKKTPWLFKTVPFLQTLVKFLAEKNGFLALGLIWKRVSTSRRWRKAKLQTSRCRVKILKIHLFDVADYVTVRKQMKTLEWKYQAATPSAFLLEKKRSYLHFNKLILHFLTAFVWVKVCECFVFILKSRACEDSFCWRNLCKM